MVENESFSDLVDNSTYQEYIFSRNTIELCVASSNNDDQDLGIFSPGLILRCKYKSTPQHIFKIVWINFIEYDKTGWRRNNFVFEFNM